MSNAVTSLFKGHLTILQVTRSNDAKKTTVSNNILILLEKLAKNNKKKSQEITCLVIISYPVDMIKRDLLGPLRTNYGVLDFTWLGLKGNLSYKLWLSDLNGVMLKCHIHPQDKLWWFWATPFDITTPLIIEELPKTWRVQLYSDGLAYWSNQSEIERPSGLLVGVCVCVGGGWVGVGVLDMALPKIFNSCNSTNSTNLKTIQKFFILSTGYKNM